MHAVSHDALDARLLRLVLRDAVRAPSSHNTQPWLFHVEDGAVELWADRSRALPIVDPKDRELTISCGAALHHLRVSLRRSGYTPEVELLAEPPRPELLARIAIGPPRVPSGLDLELADAVARRRTNRGPFRAKEVKPEHLRALCDAAESEGAQLLIVPEGKRHQLASLVAEGDRRQWRNAAFRRELAKWLRNNHDDKHRDGIPGYALGMSDAVAIVSGLVIRTLDRGDGVAAHDSEMVDGAPVLAVVVTTTNAPRAWLRAGEALSHVLLRATTLDLAASFLNQPIQEHDLRNRVAALIEHVGAPQVVLRIGYPAGPASLTPRREVDDVLR